MKEQFRDNSHSLLRALHHSTIARDYFQDCARGYTHGVKQLMSLIVVKLTQIIDGIRKQLEPELLKEVDKDLSDSLALDSITQKLVLLNLEQRATIENLITLMSKGEKIQMIDETTTT